MRNQHDAQVEKEERESKQTAEERKYAVIAVGWWGFGEIFKAQGVNSVVKRWITSAEDFIKTDWTGQCSP